MPGPSASPHHPASTHPTRGRAGSGTGAHHPVPKTEERAPLSMASTATIVTESMHTIAPSCNGTNASRPTPHQNAATEALPPRHRRSRAAVAGRQRLTPQHHPATTIPTPLAHNLQEPLNVGGRQLRPRQSIGQVLKTVTHSKLQRVLSMLRAAQCTRIHPSPPRRRSRSQAAPRRQPLHPPHPNSTPRAHKVDHRWVRARLKHERSDVLAEVRRMHEQRCPALRAHSTPDRRRQTMAQPAPPIANMHHPYMHQTVPAAHPVSRGHVRASLEEQPTHSLPYPVRAMHNVAQPRKDALRTTEQQSRLEPAHPH